MKMEDLVNELQEMVNDAKGMPFASDKVMLSRDTVLDILDEIEDAVPTEVRQAKNIVNDRNQILSQAKKEAEEIIKQAEERRKAMINQHEITKQAQAQAVEILSEAKSKAAGVKKAANQYVDDMMKTVEDSLAKQYNEIKKTRQNILDTQKKSAR
ncbi:MAG: ATPase [Oscillospiraceae bacterium]|nr:ATPase [Oscillospiraceae bacterium]